MAIETLWELYTASGSAHFRCAWGRRAGLKTIRECGFRYQIDIMSLMLTRGRSCLLADLEFDRMRCPMCGSKRYQIAFTLPGQPNTNALRVGWSETDWRPSNRKLFG